MSTGFSRQEYFSRSSPPRGWTWVSCLLHWGVDSLPLVPPGKCFHLIQCGHWKSVLMSSSWKKWKKKVKSFSHVQLFATPWTAACQAPPSVRFSRQEYWSGLPFPSPGYLPKPGTEPQSPTLPADSLPSEPPGWDPLQTPSLFSYSLNLISFIFSAPIFSILFGESRDNSGT